MDADDRVLAWAAANIRSRLNSPPIGTHEGIRVTHYRSCPELRVEVAEMWQAWYSTLTYEGWKIRTQVTCPHGEVTTNHGVTPLSPVERTLTVYTLSEIIEELDAQDEAPPS